MKKDKALLDLEREYQQKILKANEEYSSKIQQVYGEMNDIRKEYDLKIEQMKQADKE